MRIVTFKADDQLVEALDSLAKLKKKSRSEIIRKAIELYLMLENYRFQPQPKYVRLLS